MRIPFVLIVVLACCSLSSCKKKPAPAPKPVPVVVKDTVTPPPVVEEKKPVRNKIQNHFLIAGCFEYKENADKLSEKLQRQGYDSKVIPYFKNLYLVSYDGFATRQDALTAWREITLEKGKGDTWVYSSRK